MKKLALAAGLATALVMGSFAVPGYAFDENSTAAVNVDETGLGLRGFDPVAYITVGEPASGEETITASHEGVTYRFASEQNKAAFVENPSKFAPQYGGFCQMGASLGKKLDGDPEVWRVEGDKLFLYAYPAAKEGFMQDVPGNTVKANTNWPLIKDKAPKDL
ncbi:MAG: YHS domain-containing (seleno)protein [Candidatus Competibacterales bacterium]